MGLLISCQAQDRLAFSRIESRSRGANFAFGIFVLIFTCFLEKLIILESCSILCLCFIYTGEDIVFLATDINLPGAVDWVMMQSCFGHNFMLVLEKQEKIDGLQMFYAIVELIGTRKQAENFIYR